MTRPGTPRHTISHPAASMGHQGLARAIPLSPAGTFAGAKTWNPHATRRAETSETSRALFITPPDRQTRSSPVCPGAADTRPPPRRPASDEVSGHNRRRAAAGQIAHHRSHDGPGVDDDAAGLHADVEQVLPVAEDAAACSSSTAGWPS